MKVLRDEGLRTGNMSRDGELDVLFLGQRKSPSLCSLERRSLPSCPPTVCR